MSNTKKFAEIELYVLIKHNTDPDNRPLIEEFIPEILALCDKFGKSGQSGGSAQFTAKSLSNAIEKLCLQKPICPITGIDEEWTDVTKMNDGKTTYQNKRCCSLFKDGKDGEAYYIDAIVFNGDIGGRFTSHGSIVLNGVPISSFQNIKEFPFTPKTFYIDVIDHRWEDKEETQPDVNGDWWTHSIKDPAQLEEVYEYYKYPPITRKVIVEKSNNSLL